MKRQTCEKCGVSLQIHADHYDTATESIVLDCDPSDVKQHAARTRRNAKARARRRAKDDIMDSLGMVKVRGALEGIYYE